MTIDAVTRAPVGGATWSLPKILQLGLRELRSGLGGFHVFVACVALGVAVITGVGALSDAMRSGFEKQGEALLGGDVTVARPHRRAEPRELAWLAERGTVSETATLRAMARRLDGAEQILIELKGIDAAYPLAGDLKLEPMSVSRNTALEGIGAAVDPILLERLQVKIGDRLQLGKTEVVIRATIAAEPDKISDRLTFGPRVMISHPTLEATGLVEPGSLVRWRYAVKLARERGADALISFREAVKAAHPEAGFTIADRRDPSPQVTRTLERLRQFLTLIGLTALLVGGVGVANAVATYIDRRRRVIATFKSLGASSRQIFLLHLVQVVAIAGLGVAIGLAIGLALPPILERLLGDALPVRGAFSVQPLTLLLAAAYGLLVALLFTLWPLGRAGEVRAAVLFRDEVAPQRALPAWPIVAGTLAIAAALVALAVATSDAKKLALYFCLGLAATFGLFLVLGTALTWAARRLPRPRRPELALALGSLGAPGGLTRAVVLSLGSGLSLLVAVALVDRAIVDELDSRLPRNSPNFFVLDIPKADIDAFTALVKKQIPSAHVNQAPMMRGRLIKLGDRPVEGMKPPAEAQWVLNGDRGLSYADEVPEGSKVVKGAWWPKGYQGPPLVSFEADLARLLGLKVGDKVTVNVLGRNIEAEISNLREVRWESLAINFVMVFSPNTLSGAPHNLLATIALPKSVPLAEEGALAREVGKAYPAVTAIRVKDAINSFNTVFTKIMTAVRAAGGVTLLAGALVLAGALATAQRRRIKQAVIVKVLGGSSAQIMASHAIEYVLLATATAALALVLGTIAAWAVLTRIMEVPFLFSWSAVAQALGLALGLVVVLGGLGTWRILKTRPVPHLRAE
ncbi:MAG: ABC transporter permease [Hyphomicrobiaceae bacterium]